MVSGDTGQHVWTCAEYAPQYVSRVLAVLLNTCVIVFNNKVIFGLNLKLCLFN